MSRRTLIFFSLIIILVGVYSRFYPHFWNFTPVTAIALASSAYVGGFYGVGIIFAVMFLSDISLGFYEWPIMLAVYGSFLLSVFIGTLVRKKINVVNVLTGSVSASLIFFVLTNLAVWQFSGMYNHTFMGLEECFLAALPFFRGTLLGDLFFSAFFFGIFEFFLYISKSKMPVSVKIESSGENL